MDWDKLFEKGKKDCPWKEPGDGCVGTDWSCLNYSCPMFYWLRFWLDNITEDI